MKSKLPYFDKDGWLRNTSQFSEAARTFIKSGRYCEHKPGSKEWLKFWQEEERRCIEGYRLGEIEITGYHYFYLNYYPMDIVQKVKGVETRVRRFPQFWFIDWQFFRIIDYCIKNGLHFSGVKVRGCGYSEKAASMGARDMNLTFKDAEDRVMFKKMFYYASYDKYLNQLVGKSFDAMDHLNNNTDGYFRTSYMLSNKPASYERKAGILTKTNERLPTGGEVYGILVDRPDKVRGGRGNLLFFEEAGSFKNLIQAINTARPIVELNSGTSVIGTILAWGTSNVDETEVEGLKQLIYNPNGFNMVKFKNVWSPDNQVDLEFIKSLPKDPLSFVIPKDSPEYAEKGSGTGWFVPAYYVADLDEDGNPILETSLERLKKQREMVLSGQSQQDAMSYIADHPFTIDEALIKTANKEFNSYKLAKQIVDIESGILKPNIIRGTFYPQIDKKTNTISEIRFVPSSQGQISLLEHPQWAVEQPDGSWVVNLSTPTKKKLYIAGIDSIDQGSSDSETEGSKLALLIKKRLDPDNPMNPYNSSYVCKLNYRPEDVRLAYDQIGYALMYYDGLALVEYSKIAIIRYFADKKWIKYLAKEPEAPSRTIKNYSANSNKYGIRATTDIVNFYIQKIKDYLLDYADKLYFSDQLKQLSQYTREEKRKYDLIAAMGCCEILEAEFSNVLASSSVQKKVKFTPPVWYQDETGRKVFGVKPQEESFIPDIFEERMFDLKTKTFIPK